MRGSSLDRKITMTNNDTSFDNYFGVIQVNVLERAGVDFNDEASVRADYDKGRDVFDVIDEICAEYRSVDTPED